MKKDRRHAFGRESDFVADNPRHIERMLDERMTVPPGLPGKAGFRNVPRPCNQGASFLGILSEQLIDLRCISHKPYFIMPFDE